MAKIDVKVVLNLDEATEALKGFKTQFQGLGDPKGTKNIDSLRKSYANLINSIQGSEKSYKKGTFSKILEEAKKGLNDLKDPSKQTDENFKNLSKTLGRLQADFAETKTSATNFHGSLKDIVSGFMKFQLAATLVMKPLQLLRNAFDSINETLVETEKRVVALQRVAGSAANASELYKLAQQYGQSFENVADVTERFAKSGYDWSESIKAAEAALTAMNVAELDAEQASEGLIAVMKQYGYEIEDLNYIIGVLNKTSDTAAVTTEELLIALQKTGSTAKNANVSFEETVGLITALSEGTAASGQNIGNALRSLFVFTSDNKALDTFAGISEGMAETVKKYRMGQASILDIWKGLGGELEGMGSQQGTLEDLFGGRELTADIEAQLTQITDSFAEIYGTAGNYRQNYFIALLDNIEKVTDVTENLGDVTGYSQQENLKYLNTYEGKLNSLTAKWQELASEEEAFLDFKKNLLDIADLVLTLVDWTGGLRTTFLSLASVISFAFGKKIIDGIVSFTKSIKAAATAGLTLQSAFGWITAVLTVFSVIDGIVSNIKENKKEVEQQALDNAVIGLSELQKELDEINQSYEKTIQEIQKYRAVLDDSSSLESEKEKAQSSLLEIQNSLIESNNAYAGSLDLVNGKLEDQIGLTKEMQIKQIVEAVKEFQKQNKSGIDIAKTILNRRFSEIVLPYEHNLYDLTTSRFISSFAYQRDGRNQVGTTADVLDALGSIFGAETLQSSYLVQGDKISRSEAISVLEEMVDYIPQYTQDKEEAAILAEIIKTKIDELTGENYALSEDLIYGNKEDENIVKRLSNDQRMAIISGNLSMKEIEDILISVGALQKEITKNSAEWRNSLDQIGTGTLDTLVEKLKEARDATKDAYDYENKKKAVLEAEKALLDAQNNRTVRVYNRQTGTWEFASSAKAVQEAQENLDKARLEIEQAAYGEIIKLLEDGDSTNEALLKVMAHWAAAYGSGDFSGVANTIKSIVKEATGVDLDAPTKNVPSVSEEKASEPSTKKSFKEVLLGAAVAAAYKSIPDNELPWRDEPLYDNGGVLNGLGGIKATTEDEVVLSPEITKRLLSPVPNAQFDTFVKDLGILFGASESAARNGVVLSNRGGNTDSHDTSYTVNGVPISPQVAETKTVKELFELMPLIT